MSFWKYKRRIIFAIVGIVLLAGGASAAYYIRGIEASTLTLATQTKQNQNEFARIFSRYAELLKKTEEAAGKGVAIEAIQTLVATAKGQLIVGQYAAADQTITEALRQLDQLLASKTQADAQAQRLVEEAAKQQGTLKGKITASDGKVIASALVSVTSSATSAKATSDAQGNYVVTPTAGRYTLAVSKSGYTTVSKTNVEIKAQQTATQDIVLTLAPPAATAQPVASAVPGSGYEQKSVTTSRGTFTALVLTVELGNGKARLVTDTASDSDCSDNCPTKSLQSYVSSNGGFAGINGTYFCPADYADCAGKTNTFYWKVYNTRLRKIINQNNGSGEDDPAYVFTTDGKARFFTKWRDFVASGLSITAGINSKPALVAGGQNILNEGLLDSKQKTTKSNRGALGLRGDTFYAVVAKSATVVDLAAIMQALGVDSAMNIDGGGSSALYYNGAYKVGPGRSLPNAVIFAK